MKLFFLSLAQWYVCNCGVDMKHCGTKEQPCKSIPFVLTKTSDGDTIIIIAILPDQEIEICNLQSNLINHSLNIIGEGLQPLLKCKLTNNFAFHVTSKEKNKTNLTVRDVTFINKKDNRNKCRSGTYGIFRIEGGILDLRGIQFIKTCTAIFVPVKHIQPPEFVSISIDNSIFEQARYIISAYSVINAKISVISSKICGNKEQNTRITSHAISIRCQKNLVLLFQNCVLQDFHQGISVAVKGQYSIDIKDCILTGIEGQGVIITYLENKAANVSYTKITGTNFLKNSGLFASAIHLVGKAAHRPIVTISKCTFYENISKTFFGTVYADEVKVYINYCDFINNLAGELRQPIQGFGGAIYVESQTTVVAERAVFINNSCTGFGGTIFSRGKFKCLNCDFTGPSETAIRPLLGDILYATESLTLENTTWTSVDTKDENKALIWHPGSPTQETWGITISGSFLAQCPVGHNISYSGIRRKQDGSTTRISMVCQSCRKNEYSLGSGSVYMIQSNGKLEKKEQRTVQCYNCKFGGVCENGMIKPQPNYYGYKMHENDKEVQFISCPVGYCCQGESCKRFTSCQINRSGILCGRCKNGSSENLMNANCAYSWQCEHQWFWLIYIPVGFVYILVFMYLDKISNFLSEQLIWWNKKIRMRDDLEEYEIIQNSSSSSPTSTFGPNSDSDAGYKENFGDNSVDTLRSAASTHRDYKQNSVFLVTRNEADTFADILTISFYFYQMFLLLRMRESIVLTYSMKQLRSIYASIFTLSLHTQTSVLICPIYGLTAVTKLLLVKSFAAYVVVCLFCLHAIVNLVQFLLLQDVRRKQALIVFSVRLKVATIQILLISYATFSTTALTLVNCVSMYSKQVLFIDGTVTCYTWWQVIAFIFVVGWIVPFPIVMVLSLVHLKNEIISYHQFVIAWALPLLYLIWILIANLPYLKDRILVPHTKHIPDTSSSSLTEEKLSVQEILYRLECPYKSKKHYDSQISKGKHVHDHILEPTFWQGALIGKRLILILILTFIKPPVSRLYCALAVLIIYLVHHLYYKPFVQTFSNIYQTLISITLVLFCSMNLFFAYSYVSDLPPETADENLSIIFRIIEATILIIIPTLGVFVGFLLFLTRVIKSVMQLVLYAYRRVSN